MFSSSFELFFKMCNWNVSYDYHIEISMVQFITRAVSNRGSGNVFFSRRSISMSRSHNARTDSVSLIWLRAYAASFAYKLAWKLKQVRLVYGDEYSSNSCGKDVGSAVTAYKSGERTLKNFN